MEQEIPNLDTAIKPTQNSWSSTPAGLKLIIETGTPDDFLLIDDENQLLIE